MYANIPMATTDRMLYVHINFVPPYLQGLWDVSLVTTQYKLSLILLQLDSYDTI